MAQSKKKKDIISIKEMCGCFEVKFSFSETFGNLNDETYIPSKNYTSWGLEWAQLIGEDKNSLSIQHILIAGDEKEPYIIKHWRQDWIYQNTDFYFYDFDNKWKYTSKNKKDVKGQWTQKVYQVDDSPRYEGSSSWVHVDGKSYWENYSSAPLPRRELSKRKDYNVMFRGNRQEIKSFGWIHDQDNKKIVRANNEKDIVIADEKGYNIYKKVDNKRCIEAVKWWDNNKTKWKIVRDKWNEIYARRKNLALHKTVNKKPLFMYLFDKNLTNEDEINSTIELFLIN
tara:strand:- start:1071 stop:1922 length:852 start_codon:yes stop_codon:yes gene_type:complete